MPEHSFMEVWSLCSNEVTWVEGFNRTGRVSAAFQLRFFRRHGRFPSRGGDIDDESLRYLAEQLGFAVPDRSDFRFGRKSARRQRTAVLSLLKVRRATDHDREDLRSWLSARCRNSACSVEEHVETAYRRCADLDVFVPSDKIMERLVRGARHDFVEDLLAEVVERLSDDVRVRLDGSLADPKAPTGFLSLKLDAGAASLESILSACDRLDFVEELDLPYDLLNGLDPAWIRRLSRRVDGGEPDTPPVRVNRRTPPRCAGMAMSGVWACLRCT